MSENQDLESIPGDQPSSSQESAFQEPDAQKPDSPDAVAPVASVEVPADESTQAPAPGLAQDDEKLAGEPQPQVTYTSPEFYQQAPEPVSSSYTPPPVYTQPPAYLPRTSVPPSDYLASPGSAWSQEAFTAPAATNPLPLGQALRQLPGQYWYILTHPRAAIFAAEQRKAAWDIIWLQILFLAIIQALLTLGAVFLEAPTLQSLMPGEPVSQMIPTVAITASILALIFTPVFFFVGAGIYHLIARAFGGRGTFLAFCYNYALITIPIGIVTTVVSLIPCLGNLVFLAGIIYEVILLIFMTMGVHRLSGGKASASILIPVAVAAFLALCLFTLDFALLASLPQ